MFGIGLPEMIVILALALIVVGPDKLPDLARSLAKGLMELKKTAEGLKESFKEEGNPLDEIKPDLEEAAKSLKQNFLDAPPYGQDQTTETTGVNPSRENVAKAYQELLKRTGSTDESNAANIENVETGLENSEVKVVDQSVGKDTEEQPLPTQDNQ